MRKIHSATLQAGLTGLPLRWSAPPARLQYSNDGSGPQLPLHRAQSPGLRPLFLSQQEARNGWSARGIRRREIMTGKVPVAARATRVLQDISRIRFPVGGGFRAAGPLRAVSGKRYRWAQR
jgi:hypothetical protein